MSIWRPFHPKLLFTSFTSFSPSAPLITTKSTYPIKIEEEHEIKPIGIKFSNFLFFSSHLEENVAGITLKKYNINDIQISLIGI